jgi:hypothetical protein
MDNYYNKPEHYSTGVCPDGFLNIQREVTEKGKVDIWFCDPLLKMKDDEAFVCMMVCFPLIELIIRKDLGIPDDSDVTFSDNSPALKWFAKFLKIPDDVARMVWDSFRNGLAHRGMIKDSISYKLSGGNSDRSAKFENGILTVYVWSFRDEVVALLKNKHRNLWKDSSSPLPGIYQD